MTVRTARWIGRAPFAVLVTTVLAACSGGSDDLLPPEEPPPAAVQVASRDPHPGIAGEQLPDSVVVRVVDGEARGVPGVTVSFAVNAGGGSITPALAGTDGEGYARAAWVLGAAGEQSASARVEGVQPAQLHARFVTVPPTAAPMLARLGEQIPSAAAYVLALAQNNPQAASSIQAKVAMLRTPGLGGDILDNARWVTGTLPTGQGASVPLTAVFATEPMRAEAAQTVHFLEGALPVVQAFLNVPYPAQNIRVWHGFIVGNSGGGGTLNMEDRASYEARTPATRLPYDAIVVHELCHTWMGHESLNQFLELYGYNVLLTGSTDPGEWIYTRGWTPGADGNTGIAAILDIYDLLGRDAMANAYRALLQIHPPYGQPPSQAAQQAFVDAAPAAAKAQVAAKAAKIGF